MIISDGKNREYSYRNIQIRKRLFNDTSAEKRRNFMVFQKRSFHFDFLSKNFLFYFSMLEYEKIGGTCI